MARVVCVHGIAKRGQERDAMLRTWWSALSVGLSRAGVRGVLRSSDVAMAYYQDVFDFNAHVLADVHTPISPWDFEDGFDRDLLTAFWHGEPALRPPEPGPQPFSVPLVVALRSMQAGLRVLCGSRLITNVAARALIADLKQVRSYLFDEAVRMAVRDRVDALIGSDTRVVVAHSLGSIAAYEVLCARSSHGVRALITLGSPLGVRNLVFDRLRPRPLPYDERPRGHWPGGPELVWTNLAAEGDVIALVKDLRPLFGPEVRAEIIRTGVHAHNARMYLTHVSCGQSIAVGLALK